MRENVRDNKVLIHMPLVKDRQLAKAFLSKSSLVTSSKITVDDTKKMFPKITVTNIPNYIFEEIEPKLNKNTI